MTGTVDPRLVRLLGSDDLAALRKRLRRRFERNGPAAPPPFRLGGLSEAEHAALAALLGRPARHAASIEVDVAALDAALHGAGIAPSLRAALEVLEGPLVDRSGVEAGWRAVAADARHPVLAAFLKAPPGLGLLKRLARQDTDRAVRLRDGTDSVLERLPAAGLPRAQLAAETLGDAHALDGGQPVATLVLAAWRGEASQPAERVRDQWARLGVLVNELARPALILNLPGFPPGEPAYVSLRRLLRTPPAWPVAGRTVHVCENPNLLAIAADRLGPAAAPLVCTDGMPAAAQRTLLAQLAAAGAHLYYHGDFDWPGIAIANHVMRTYGARPWRFGAADYRAALPVVPRRGHRLAGTPVAAAWDANLAPAMREAGVAVAEESLATSLLADLEGVAAQ